jgi:Tol biopolymer transport system component
VLSPSLSLDSAGNPVITFVHFGINVLHCNDANCAGGDESLVTHGACCPTEARHVLAHGDLPVVFFRHTGMQMLRCANTNCTALSNNSTLLIQPDNTQSYSFALDANGFPVVGYIGNSSGPVGDLMLMHCNDANCDPAVNGAESNLVVDNSSVAGVKVDYRTALTLHSGNPVMAYSHFDTSTLKIARCDDPNCAAGGDTIEFANTNTGAHSPGIAIDGDGVPVVAYYDGFARTFVLHCNDASCSGANESDPLVMTNGSNSPSPNGAPSLALDGDGFPVASLYRGEGNNLAILHCGDENCSVPALPTATPTFTPTNTPAATSTPTDTATPTDTPTATPTTAPGSNGRIVFTTDRSSDNFDLFVMDADGANPTCLTNTVQPAQSFRPYFSPDGTKVVFVRNQGGINDRELFVVDADGTDVLPLTTNAFFDDEPAWSPDGAKIAFTSNRDGNQDVFVMNADGTNPVNLTGSHGGGFDDGEPAWSPDGTKIAFTSYRDVFTLQAEVYVMNADGSLPLRLSNDTFMDHVPSWSPDGTTIAFASTRDGNNEIYAMDATDGANQTRLTSSASDDVLPEFSPDGLAIAFATNRDGNYEIYAMSAVDGAGATNLTNSPGIDTQHSWTGVAPIALVCPAPEATATPTPTSTLPPTNTPTNTPIPPTDTPTNTPILPTDTPTNTPAPPTDTPTNTPVPPTDTPTNTPVPPTDTPTNTPVPPTDTPTNTPVPPTDTPTHTPVPPTDTPTHTPVPPTDTPTNTPLPPTDTPTNTPVPPTDTPTNTPVPPTDTPTNTPAPPTSTPTQTPTPTGILCGDLNGDGRVNSGDILRVLLRVVFHRPYVALYDVDQDGDVDIQDVLAVARQYGRRCHR